MQEDPKEQIEMVRDSRGRFVKGSKVNARKEGEEVVPNEKYPHLSQRGHFLPGKNYHSRYLALAELEKGGNKVLTLKRALLEAVHPEQVERTINRLWRLTVDESLPPSVALQAMQLFFDRCIGRPPKEISIEKHEYTQQVSASVDLSKLSEDDLRQMQGILEKAEQPTMIEAQVTEGDASTEH